MVSGREESNLDASCRVVLPSLIAGVLRQVVVSHKLLVIAAQWPSWLVTLTALEIPFQEAYFPAIYHGYF